MKEKIYYFLEGYDLRQVEIESVIDVDGRTETTFKLINTDEGGNPLPTDKYTVWVGGTEVNDSLLEYDDAMKLADSYRKKEYDDVIVECIEYNEGVK